MSPGEVHVNRPFQDLGIDSLMAVAARNRLAELSGLALPATIAFDHRNAKALGQFLKPLGATTGPSQESTSAMKENAAQALTL
ncbi:hypothetical protein NUH16_002893 [Penicillium rubens]|jgi:hypothetical protein|uniref:uncharacterized protein n=1 Tax=Penicillium rubens TaxID=1108849 RepID=UPI002A5A6CC9|nr:uncharacterized protein N7525_003044 [Penicillium rubens]KAJ5046068.1 hypothetical protein NUH16_002893 [Penicillium rubens]KAJ5837856.1 hypothetical protein N7525_003044 [Penicillium rubens]